MTVKPVTERTVLDVDSGIERLMGNSGIYCKALKRFTAHIEAARNVAAQLAAGDDAGAYLTIHTLKGAAGLLGAGEVAAVALDVETALSRGGPVQPLLDDLEGALQRVQVCIDAALAAPMPKIPAHLQQPPCRRRSATCRHCSTGSARCSMKATARRSTCWINTQRCWRKHWAPRPGGPSRRRRGTATSNLR
jgi:HPt (histidine-containing phosphotransfer) domain-containing protein